VHHEHRQDEEKTQHAQAEYAGKARAGAQLDTGHTFGH
jgi:hypothetical protein